MVSGEREDSKISNIKSQSQIETANVEFTIQNEKN
jgi:hypothetical protein